MLLELQPRILSVKTNARIPSVKTKNTAEWGELIAVCAFLSQLSQSLPLPPSPPPFVPYTERLLLSGPCIGRQ